MAATIALIAHDSRKDLIVDFAQQHHPVLSRYRLIATGTTGQRIQEATGLTIERKLSGPLGGDTQIAAEICDGQVCAVIFLVDPLYAQPHEPDIQALLRVCNVHNIPLATNLPTAEAIITYLAKRLVAHLVFNPASGQGDPDEELALIRQLLDPHLDLQIHTTTATDDPRHLAEMAVAANADVVIASGGDGTVSAVAGALIGTGIPLGIIPTGTANAFATSLGLPRLLTIRAACQVILAGHRRTIDAATCNGKPFVLLTGVGYEAEAVERASRDLKAQWGAMAYFMAGFQVLDDHKRFDAEIEVDGQRFLCQAHAITIANSAPITSILAQGSGNVVFDDGLLDITIITVEGKLQAIATLLTMLGGALVKSASQQQNVVYGRAKRLQISTDPPQKVVVDGEIVGTTPIVVECIPKGLVILAPSS
ncbi:MAG: methylglyoxal synthase [Cyanobacteria bacterium]|nr:methylglyoxal synthase [Cyanobacteriota bacterium]MDW8201527.1 methylglyoxal synthase [Cyanobacteriota bacterium SKYGB_h_bin112]